MKAMLRHVQPKYINVEGVRMVTNNRYVAEQITNDKVENVATGGGFGIEIGKVGRSENFKSIIMNGIKIDEVENVGKK